jgi:N-acetylglucosaminyldiphosphoundecaprenol N-acetyl-beta-D-mannosaminyltransferase
LAAAAGSATPVGFYGTTAETLEKLSAAVKRTHPELVIAYASAPPFEQLNRTEERETARQIRESGARILFVGLGCPKQEHWMARHREDVPAVMLGVGAAFDFIAGTKRQAPRRMQQMGCEWLFRLVTEPRRLAGRYFRSNPRFLWHWGIDLVRGRLGAGI